MSKLNPNPARLRVVESPCVVCGGRGIVPRKLYDADAPSTPAKHEEMVACKKCRPIPTVPSPPDFPPRAA